jgi:hypothetical protein
VVSSTYDEGRSEKNSDGEEWVLRSKIQADLVSLFYPILKTPVDNIPSVNNATVKDAS